MAGLGNVEALGAARTTSQSAVPRKEPLTVGAASTARVAGTPLWLAGWVAANLLWLAARDELGASRAETAVKVKIGRLRDALAFWAALARVGTSNARARAPETALSDGGSNHCQEEEEESFQHGAGGEESRARSKFMRV